MIVGNDTVIGHLYRQYQSNPEKTALVYGIESYSYRELFSRITSYHAFLKKMGIQPGDRVAFSASSDPVSIFLYFAIHLAGAVSVPVDIKISKENAAYILGQLEPAAVFSESLPASTQILHSREMLKELPEKDGVEFHFPSPGDTADILFTTGTTGQPKGVMLTHKNIWAGAVNTIERIGNDSSDAEIVPLPLHHAFGLRRIRINMMLGATVVLVDGFIFPRLIFEAISTHHVTGICLVPAGLSVIKTISRNTYLEHFKQLKYIEFGSASLSMSLKHELIEGLPSTRIFMHYGLTEAAANIFTEFHESEAYLDALGKPSPNVSIRIRGENGRNCLPGEIGEIQVKGEVVMKAYLNDEKGTEEAINDHWFRTGDLGYTNEQGYVYLAGRSDDIINVGGKKVSPLEIERVLDAFPHISESAVVAAADPAGITGSTIRAFLVLEKGYSLGEVESGLVRYLREHLENFKIPGSFEILKSIPRTGSGKIMRSSLR